MSNGLSLTMTESGDDAAKVAAAEREAATHPEYENAVLKVQRALEERCEQARRDPTLAPAERQDTIRWNWNQATETYRHLREAYERQLEADVEQKENALFKVDHHLRSDVRSAYELVYRAASGPGEQAREELQRYADRARRTGDRALEIAVGHLSIERGVAELRDPFLAASRERQKAWEEYNHARKKQDSFGKLRLSIATGTRSALVMPAELRS